jgi:hypothetical protein
MTPSALKKSMFMLSCTFASEAGDSTDATKREWELYQEAFQFGMAWSGSLKMVFFESEKSSEFMMSKFCKFMKDADFIFLMNIDTGEVSYSGWLVDEDGFETLFPKAKRFAEGRGWVDSGDIA